MRALRIPPTAIALAILPLVAGTACSKGMSGTTSESVVSGPSGAIVTETFSTTATIVAIDQAKMKAHAADARREEDHVQGVAEHDELPAASGRRPGERRRHGAGGDRPLEG